MSSLTFRQGFTHGIPICLGYFSVSFAFGMIAAERGFPIIFPILISVTNLTGTGQFAGMELAAAGAAISEIAFTVLIINLRYMLMSLSVSQKFCENYPMRKRLLTAFGITDEIYAVAVRQTDSLSPAYMAGLILCSYAGWVGGTALGAVCGSLFPESVISALGIALYAMFIAIIVPPASESKPVLLIVLGAAAVSCIFKYVPFLSHVSSGWVIIISGVSTAALGAWLAPDTSEDTEIPEDQKRKEETV